MAARLRRVHYDEMSAIVKSFRTEQQEIEALYKQTKSKVESLHNNQWVGQGAEKWFSEMEGQVLPAVQRLIRALDYAGDTAQKIHETIHKHDEETKSFFAKFD
jgi:WXG100 family type VII secretion target